MSSKPPEKMTPTAHDDTSTPSPPRPPPRPHRRTHSGLAGLLGRMFSPSRAEQGSYPGPDAVADSDGYGHFRGEGEGETDSAYRDLGLDPDKLTDFNIATDIPFADVEGGDGAGGRGRGTATGAPMSPSADERKSRSWRWGRGRSKSRNGSHSRTRTHTRSRSRGLSLSRNRKSLSRFVEDDIPPLPGAGQQQQQSKLLPASVEYKSKRKLTKPTPTPTKSSEPLPPLPKIRPSATYAEASALANAPDTNAPLPPLPPSLIYTPKGQRPLPPPPETTTNPASTALAPTTTKPVVKPKAEELLRAKEQVRRQRRDLRASGDWLGVQGSDPVTGEPEVLTPLDTPTASSSGSSSAARRLLEGLAGRRRNAEAELARAREQEEQGRLCVRDAREARHRAKLESIENRKEGVRARQRAASASAALDGDGDGGEDAGGASEGDVARTLRQHGDQWSSLAEPNLSPIAQSVNSSANNLLEPSPSPTLPGPSRAMKPPNFSRPRASGSGNSPWSHRRTQSTDTIVHNPDKGKGKGKSLDHERHSTGYPTPRKSQEPGHHHQPEEVEEEKKEKEARKSFLWRRRRRMTDPGSRDRTLVAGIGASAASLSTACGFPPGSPSAPSPLHHRNIMDVAIPDYHLHLLTPEPADTPKAPAKSTDSLTINNTTNILCTPLNLGSGKTAANDLGQHTSAATATLSPSKSKELMRKLSVRRRKSVLSRQGSGRVSAAKATTAANVEAQKAEESLTGALRRSLDSPPTCDHTPLYKGDGLEVHPSNGAQKQRSLGMSLTDARASGPNLLYARHQDHADILSLSLRDAQSNGSPHRRHRYHGAESPLAELPAGNSKSSNRSRSPAQTATHRPVRRFAFIPTTTTTGCDRGPGSRSVDNRKENRPPRPDSLIVETGCDDLATPTSSPPPILPREERIEPEERKSWAGRAIIIPESWARLRHSRRVPLRKSSLNFTHLNAAGLESSDEEMQDARATGTTSTNTQTTSQSDETSESEMYVSAMSEIEDALSPKLTKEPTSLLDEDTPTRKTGRDGLGKGQNTPEGTPELLSAETMTLRMVSPTLTTRAKQEDSKDTREATVGRVKMLAKGFDQREKKNKSVSDGRRQEKLEVIPVIVGDPAPAHHLQQRHQHLSQTSDKKSIAKRERDILDQEDTETDTDTDEEETGLDGTFDGILDGFPVPPTSKNATMMYTAPSPRIMQAAAMWGGAKQALGTIALNPRQDHHRHPFHHYQTHWKTKSCNGAELATMMGSMGVGVQEPSPDKWHAGLAQHRRSRSDVNSSHGPKKDIPRGRVLGSQMTGLASSSRNEEVKRGAGAVPTTEEAEKALQSTLQRKLEQEIRKEKARQRRLERLINASPSPSPPPTESPPPRPQRPPSQTNPEIEYRISGQEKFFAIPDSVLPPRHPSQVQVRNGRRESRVVMETLSRSPSPSPPPPRRRKFPPRVTDPPETPPPPSQEPEMQRIETHQEQPQEEEEMGARSWLSNLPTRLPLPNLAFRRRRAAALEESSGTANEGRQQTPDQRGRTTKLNGADTTRLPEHTPDAVKAARQAAIHDRERKNGGAGATAVDTANNGSEAVRNAALVPIFVAYLLGQVFRTIAKLAWAIIYAWWLLACPALVDWCVGAENGIWRRRRDGRTTWADTVSLVAAALLFAASVVVGWYLGVVLAWLGFL